MPRARWIWLWRDPLFRIFEGKEAADERPHRQRQSAAGRTEERAVAIGLLLQDAPRAVGAKNVVAPGRIAAVIVIVGICSSAKLVEVRSARIVFDPLLVAQRDIN